MRRLLQLGTLVIAALATAHCATMDAGSHVRRGVDFTRYRTFDWGAPDALPASDPRFDRNPSFKDYFHGTVERQLADRGLARSVSGKPDLLIHYHASIDDRVVLDRSGAAQGYCYDEDCQSGVIPYERGTFVLDFIDAKTNAVVWRGWAQQSVDGVLDNPSRMSRQINLAVTRMLQRLPRVI